MKSFKVTPKFLIFFTLITVFPATWLAHFFQYLLQHLSSNNLIKQLIDWGLIYTPTTIVIIYFLFWLYEAHFWKVWLFQYIHRIPNINGRYEGETESSFDNHKHKIFLEVKQTLLNISVNLYSSEQSFSHSYIANLVKNEQGNWSLVYIYKSNPITISEDLDMRAHDGSANLQIFPKEQLLKGRYFNDSRERPTFGFLYCRFSSKELKGHF